MAIDARGFHVVVNLALLHTGEGIVPVDGHGREIGQEVHGLLPRSIVAPLLLGRHLLGTTTFDVRLHLVQRVEECRNLTGAINAFQLKQQLIVVLHARLAIHGVLAGQGAVGPHLDVLWGACLVRERQVGDDLARGRVAEHKQHLVRHGVAQLETQEAVVLAVLLLEGLRAGKSPEAAHARAVVRPGHAAEGQLHAADHGVHAHELEWRAVLECVHRRAAAGDHELKRRAHEERVRIARVLAQEPLLDLLGRVAGHVNPGLVQVERLALALGVVDRVEDEALAHGGHGVAPAAKL